MATGKDLKLVTPVSVLVGDERIRLEQDDVERVVTPRQLGNWQGLSVTLDAAAIMALNDADLAVITAPGEGKILAWPVCTAATAGDQSRQTGNLSVKWDGSSNGIGGFSIDAGDVVVMIGVDSYDGMTFTRDEVENKAIVLHASVPFKLAGSILTHSASVGGAYYRPGDTFVVDDGGGLRDGLAMGVVDAVGNSYAITAINQGAKTITVAGDLSALAPDDSIEVDASTGNDGFFTVVTAVFGTGHTVITVSEAIASGVVSGFVGNRSGTDNTGNVTAYTLLTTPYGYIPAIGGDSGQAINTSTVSAGANGLVINIDTVDLSENPMVVKFDFSYQVLALP